MLEEWALVNELGTDSKWEAGSHPQGDAELTPR